MIGLGARYTAATIQRFEAKAGPIRVRVWRTLSGAISSYA